MNACYGCLNSLSLPELAAIADGRTDAPECEVTGAQAILAEVARAVLWRNDAAKRTAGDPLDAV